MTNKDVRVLELANDENDDWLKKVDPSARTMQLEIYKKIRNESSSDDRVKSSPKT